MRLTPKTCLAASARGMALAGVALAGWLPLAVVLAAAGLTAAGAVILVIGSGGHDERWHLGLGVLMLGAGLAVARFVVPGALARTRRLAGLTRQLSGRWCGVPIAEPYRPAGATNLMQDPATWRDLAWVTVSLLAGWAVAALSAASVVAGLLLALAGLTGILPSGFSGHPQPALAMLGMTIVAAGLVVAPWLLRGYGLLARSMLGPPGQARLASQVRHLTQTRAEALDAGAAEIRRIERDLHDGAQARLVAMGMTLDAAGQVIDTNPEAARALLYEARDASVKALTELRALVRGIHPPVLADRGLPDAIRALALDSPLRIEVVGNVRGRLPAPVESAAYFAVSELLANVSKHADAQRTWIDIRHAEGMLRVGVTDDGHGGADPAAPKGTGLRGIERRLSAFDGVLAVSSPPGGPTSVTMEIPCALSSPKTSSC